MLWSAYLIRLQRGLYRVGALPGFTKEFAFFLRLSTPCWVRTDSLTATSILALCAAVSLVLRSLRVDRAHVFMVPSVLVSNLGHFKISALRISTHGQSATIQHCVSAACQANKVYMFLFFSPTRGLVLVCGWQKKSHTNHEDAPFPHGP